MLAAASRQVPAVSVPLFDLKVRRRTARSRGAPAEDELEVEMLRKSDRAEGLVAEDAAGWRRDGQDRQAHSDARNWEHFPITEKRTQILVLLSHVWGRVFRPD